MSSSTDFANAPEAASPPAAQVPTPPTPAAPPAGEGQTAQPNGNAGQSAAPDINSLDQFNEVEQIDPDASTYDQTPPPPDGWHAAILRPVKDAIDQAKRVAGEQFQNSVGWFGFNDRDGKYQKHLNMAIEIQINEEGKPWHKQSVREWPSTMKSGDTTQIDTLLRQTTGQAGVGLSNSQKITKLYQKLVTEPQVWVKTRWILQATEETPVLDKSGQPKVKQSGEAKTEYRIFKYGMAQFPPDLDAEGKQKKNADGSPKYRVLTEDPKEGAGARTKFEVVDMRPFSAGPPK